MKKVFVLIVVLFFGLNIYSQEKYFTNESDIQEFSKRVTLLFNNNKVQEAFSELKLYWPLPETEIELIKEKTIKGLNTVGSIYGNSIGIKKIKYKNLEDVAIREVYFSLYEISALRFIYTYYKTDKGWIVNQFKFDEDFDEEF